MILIIYLDNLARHHRGREGRRKFKQMEGFLVSAATGALKAVTVKLAAFLGDEFKNMKDVCKEIDPLSEELNCIHAFLVEMSKEENLTDKEKIWMTEVREVSYDIEDSLDDFMIHINNDDNSAKAKGLSLIKKCKRLLDMMKAHHRISKVVHDFFFRKRALARVALREKWSLSTST
ncbi:putative disease resistance RPP13-like protein 3 [Sorghum bicolor]|uniref:putative disease resistance RPP13-like protein 3 n=1 Tax=Sorghum bicolor TaxID=4558 RepID=UPI000B426237|nr:putative disease resistance RPP13-like protein 3 [Sorghum bicolor]|eukprot:XP_021303267.1 putative disease resistance RPP13-like protein 3 [Sorghum bicolor]